jgi:hypothetical protein
MSDQSSFTTSNVDLDHLMQPGQAAGPDVQEMGESIRLGKEEIVTLTKELCTELLEMKEFVAERSIRDAHVAYLQRCMVRGLFRPEQVILATAHCQEDKAKYRINGQHTAWAFITLPDDIQQIYKVRMYRYTCKTIDDVRILYGTFDRNYSRSNTTVVNSILLGREGYEEFDRGMLNVAVNGFSLWKWEVQNRHYLLDIDSRCHIMDAEYHIVAKQILTFLKTNKSKITKHIWRAPVVAAMFETFTKCQSAAREFWISVTTGVGFFDKSDPRLVLKNYLERSTIDGKKSSDRKPVSQEEMYRGCVMAWNKWRSNEGIKQLSPNSCVKRPRAK